MRRKRHPPVTTPAGQVAPPPDLAARLRAVRQTVAALVERSPAAARAADRLDRDLLPRTAGGADCLVVGIVGPNNAGKSALFNGLVGRTLSPSRPEGGATRRLVGAAAPELLERLRQDPSLARFSFSDLDGSEPATVALSPSDDPGELLVAAVDSLPTTLLLIDTPDFDSVLEANRVLSDALLTVVDLAVAVVAKHSYRNREVVEFLGSRLAHGRPWMCVYNEGTVPRVAASHCERLADDVGSPPLATFWSRFDHAVAAGERPLVARSLAPDGADLREALLDAGGLTELKRRALEASLSGLSDDLAAAAAELEAVVACATDLRDACTARALELGRRVAGTAMPGAPFLGTFREILDRRVGRLRGLWRRGMKAVGDGARWVWSRTPWAQEPPEASAVLSEHERQALEAGWPRFWEAVVRDVGAEGRLAARARADEAVTVALDADLDELRRDELRTAVAQELGERAVDTSGFAEECARLVEAALDERGRDWDLQAAHDALTALPAVAAGVVIVVTGGPGVDAVAGGLGAAGTVAMQWVADLLGRRVADAARERWADLRGRQVADVVLDVVFERSLPALQDRIDEGRRSVARLSEAREALT